VRKHRLNLLCRITATILCLFVCPSTPAQSLPTTRPRSAMVIYDSLISYKDKPDTRKLGLRPIYVADREFWRGGDTSERADTSEPDEASCRKLGAKVAAMGCPLVIDIEHWPCDVRSASRAEVSKTIDKFTKIVRWCRAGARRKLKIGCYGIPPICDYWTVIGNDPAKLKQWHEANAVWMDFAREVDFIFPSLYTFYGPDYFDGKGDYKADWVRFANANIEQAKRYGKPVAGFLWPRYHSSNAKFKEQFIDADYFRLELQTCRDAGIDVVLWDWSGFDNFKPFDWRASGTWWDAARDFFPVRRRDVKR
jgi:hypothetical protein